MARECADNATIMTFAQYGKKQSDFTTQATASKSNNTIEIVRCKECQNCEKVPSILGTVLYCNEWCKDVAEDTFCSFGAKMKGGAE